MYFRLSCNDEHKNEINCKNCDEAFENYGKPIITLFQLKQSLYIRISSPLKLKKLSSNLRVDCRKDSSQLGYFINTEIKNPSSLYLSLEKETNHELLYEIMNLNREGSLLPGRYWCIGFEFPHFNIIKSNTIVYKTNYFNFEVVMNETIDIETESSFENIYDKIDIDKSEYLQLGTYVTFPEIIPFGNNKVTVPVHFIGRFGRGIENLQYFYEKYPNRDILLADYCQESKSVITGSEFLVWNSTPIGQIVPSSLPCFDKRGNIITRTCTGTTVIGANWTDINGVCQIRDTNSLTDQLLDLINSLDSIDQITEELFDIVEKYEELTSIYDIFLICKTLQKIAESNETIDIKTFTEIVSRLTDYNEQLLENSQFTLNATDIILESIDVALKNYISNTNREYLGVVTKNLIIHATNFPNIIYNCLVFFKNDSTAFNKNCNFDEAPTDLEFAVIIPYETFEHSSNKTYLFAIMFKKSTLFNSIKSKEKIRVTGRIPNIFTTGKQNIFLNTLKKQSSLLGLKLLLLHEPLRIIIKPFRTYRRNHFCGYWKYGINDQQISIKGRWKKGTSAEKFGDFYICEFWHMTHYAILLDNISNKNIDTFSVIGSISSLIGITIIFITAIMFKQWRQDGGSKILLQFCSIIVLQIILLFLADDVDSFEQETLCVVIGALLYYTVMSQFFWMMVIGFFQYKRFVVVFKDENGKLIVTASFLCWILPLLPVGITILFSYESYIRDEYCYLTGNGLLYGAIIPISAMVLVNCFLFIKIMTALKYKSFEDKVYDKFRAFLQVRLGFCLFFLMGLTWVFGILNGFLRSNILSYLFCVTSSVQGCVIFFFFIVLNKNVVEMWRNWLRKRNFQNNFH